MTARSFHAAGLVLAIATLSASGSATAATQTANLNVTATVVADCTISTGDVSFGNYLPVTTHAAADLDANGSVTITCTNGDSVDVTLGQGANADTGSTDAAPLRRMTDGSSHYLNYQLYSDAAGGTVWDNSTGVNRTGTGAADALTVYGRVAQGQNPTIGSYSDTVVATVTF